MRTFLKVKLDLTSVNNSEELDYFAFKIEFIVNTEAKQ